MLPNTLTGCKTVVASQKFYVNAAQKLHLCHVQAQQTAYKTEVVLEALLWNIQTRVQRTFTQHSNHQHCTQQNLVPLIWNCSTLNFFCYIGVTKQLLKEGNIFTFFQQHRMTTIGTNDEQDFGFMLLTMQQSCWDQKTNLGHCHRQANNKQFHFLLRQHLIFLPLRQRMCYISKLIRYSYTCQCHQSSKDTILWWFLLLHL